jgi:hypothetical protein
MLGCSHVQGYIYERPLSALNAAARLSTGLVAVAQGPRSARASRQSMLRKVVLENAGHKYNGVIRNISLTGALIEGLWNVPPGTVFRIQLADGHTVSGTCRWSNDDRMGVEFAAPLKGGRRWPHRRGAGAHTRAGGAARADRAAQGRVKRRAFKHALPNPSRRREGL